MKSVQINEYGGSEIIKVNQSSSEPTVSTGKVLVTIKAAGVNPADWKIREGYSSRWPRFNSHQPWGWIFLELLNRLE